MPIAPQDVERYREVLLEQRDTLLGSVANLAKDAQESTESTGASKSPLDQAENAADSYEQDFAFISMESEEELLRKIDGALRRIQEGGFGTCEECGDEIKPERLEVLPFADLCLTCQEREERRKRRGHNGDFEVVDEFEEEAAEKE